MLLADQDRSRWNRQQIVEGMRLLRRGLEKERPGPYQIQATIAALHADATRAEDTDWPRIAQLYDDLVAVAPSPVVELNRAVAVAMAYGPQAGLELVDALIMLKTLEHYHLLPSVRGDFLAKLGRHDEARVEFERAAALTRNARERDLLLERARASAAASTSVESR